MKISRFVWMESIVQKLIRKHSVHPDEVIEIFANRPRFHAIEKGDRKGENVYSASGQTDGGRYLICYFIRKINGDVLILSARDMTGDERKRYGRK
jgi:uncharacterized protein